MKVTGLISDALKSQPVDDRYRMPKIVTENKDIVFKEYSDMPYYLYFSVWNESIISQINSGKVVYHADLNDEWSIEIFLQDLNYGDRLISDFYENPENCVYFYTQKRSLCIRILHCNNVILMEKIDKYLSNTYKIMIYEDKDIQDIMSESKRHWRFSEWEIAIINKDFDSFDYRLKIKYKYSSEDGYTNGDKSFYFYPFSIKHNLYFCDYDELMQKSGEIINLINSKFGGE